MVYNVNMKQNSVAVSYVTMLLVAIAILDIGNI